jgi:cell division protein FtsZ
MTPPASSTQSLENMGPRIAVVGVGGAGCNAIDNMIRSDLQGVTFLVCNTDAQALSRSLCPESQRVRLGFGVTQGLGAGSIPENGRLAAEESLEDVLAHLKGVHMVFITAGMGGGTGTGAAPVIAKAAKEMGVLTVGVVTKPFHFEGSQRMRVAEKGIETMRACVDTLLVIPNQNLFRFVTSDTTVLQAFAIADEVLYAGVRTFTDVMIKPGLVNSDFADICTVMRDMPGKAMMGTGEAVGEARAIEAAEKAIACLMLDDVSIQGARAIFINIACSESTGLLEIDTAISYIKKQVETDPSQEESVLIIFSATLDKDLKDVFRVSVVATGIHDRPKAGLTPAAINQGVSEASSEMGFEAVALGSRHGDYFQTPSFPNFSLQEDAEPFGYTSNGYEGESYKTAPGYGTSPGQGQDFGSDDYGQSQDESAPKVSFLGRLFRRNRNKDAKLSGTGYGEGANLTNSSAGLGQSGPGQNYSNSLGVGGFGPESNPDGAANDYASAAPWPSTSAGGPGFSGGRPGQPPVQTLQGGMSHGQSGNGGTGPSGFSGPIQAPQQGLTQLGLNPSGNIPGASQTSSGQPQMSGQSGGFHTGMTAGGSSLGRYDQAPGQQLSPLGHGAADEKLEIPAFLRGRPHQRPKGK